MATNMNVPDYGAFFKQLDPVEQDTVKDVNDLQGTNYSFFNKIQDTVQQNTINPKFGQVSAGKGGGGVSKEAEKKQTEEDGDGNQFQNILKNVLEGKTQMSEAVSTLSKPLFDNAANYYTNSDGQKILKELPATELKNNLENSFSLLKAGTSKYKNVADVDFTIPFVSQKAISEYEYDTQQIKAANELNGGDFKEKIEGFMKQKDEWDAHKEKMSKFYGAQTGIGSTQDAVKTADGERSLLRSWVPIQGQQGIMQKVKPLQIDAMSAKVTGRTADNRPTYSGPDLPDYQMSITGNKSVPLEDINMDNAANLIDPNNINSNVYQLGNGNFKYSKSMKKVVNALGEGGDALADLKKVAGREGANRSNTMTYYALPKNTGSAIFYTQKSEGESGGSKNRTGYKIHDKYQIGVEKDAKTGKEIPKYMYGVLVPEEGLKKGQKPIYVKDYFAKHPDEKLRMDGGKQQELREKIKKRYGLNDDDERVIQMMTGAANAALHHGI